MRITNRDKLREVAEGLVSAVEGLPTEANINGILQVFEGLIEGVNNNWEDHIAAQTEDMLMYAETLCACGRLIEIVRTNKEASAKGNM